MDMQTEYGISMTEDEIEEFLCNHGHGVLSLSDDGDSYGIPMSFGYDAENGRCILQFVSDDESDKEAHLDATQTVTLTAYEWTAPDDWRSVVLTGTVREVDDEDVAEAAAIFSAHGSAVALTIFGRPLSELTATWYELDVESVTGRKPPA